MVVRPEDHLAVRGILYELPPVNSEWSIEERQEWIDAILAVFKFIYKSA